MKTRTSATNPRTLLLSFCLLLAPVLDAGAGAGLLTLKSGVNLSIGTYVWELTANSTNSPGVNFDQTVISGGSLVLTGASKLSLNFSGSATLPNLADPFWQASRSWTIMALSGSASNVGLSSFTTLLSAQYPSLQYFTQSADARGNIVLTYDPTTVFYALYDAGPGFNVGEENLILTNVSGQTFYVWSTLNPGHSVTNWTSVGAMSEQPLNDGTGRSRYSITVTPAGSPAYYIAVKAFGPFYPPTVPAHWITTSEFGDLAFFGTNVAINAAGVLALPGLPVIVQQPVSKTVLAGQSPSFAVTAVSYTPMGFQWYFNTSTPVANGANAILTLPPVTSANAGNYSVVVTNAYGGVTSAIASLTVLPPPKLSAQKVATGFQLSGYGVPGDSYWVKAATNLTPPIPWVTLSTNVAGPDGLVLFTDTNTAGRPIRFYRLVSP